MGPSFFDWRGSEGRVLPDYVRREFDEYLKCGCLEHDFLRVQCESCLTEYLVAFSCKRRGFCPSCGARRMVESAALLVRDTEHSNLPLEGLDEDPMDQLRGHSITYRIAVGPQQGRKVFTLQTLPDERDADDAPAVGNVAGFSLRPTRSCLPWLKGCASRAVETESECRARAAL
jgi:hypothetical protein